MANHQKDFLFVLIKSLSKSEKRQGGPVRFPTPAIVVRTEGFPRRVLVQQ